MAKLINKFVDDVVQAEKDGTFRSTAGTGTKEAIKRQLREVPGLGMISPRTGEDGKDIPNQWNFQASSNPGVGKMLRYEKWASEGRKLSPQQQEYINSQRPAFNQKVEEWSKAKGHNFKNSQSIFADPASDFTNDHRLTAFKASDEKAVLEALRKGEVPQGTFVKNTLNNPKSVGENMSPEAEDEILNILENNEDLYRRMRYTTDQGGSVIPDNQTTDMKGSFAQGMGNQIQMMQMERANLQNNSDMGVDNQRQRNELANKIGSANRALGHVRYNTGQDFGSAPYGNTSVMNPNKVVPFDYKSNPSADPDRPLGILANMLDQDLVKGKDGKTTFTPKTKLTDLHSKLIDAVGQRAKALEPSLQEEANRKRQ